ncbi:MAG: ribonuclease J, partial [Kibdelosporangium sp.]
YCYNIVQPSNVMPVHGEWRHLTANGELAIRTGVPAENVVLAEEGFITIVALVDADTGKLTEPPEFLARGFVHDDKTFDAVVPLIEKALDEAVALVEMELSRTEAEGIIDPHRIAQVVRRAVGRWVAEKYRRRPMIVPTVIPV